MPEGPECRRSVDVLRKTISNKSIVMFESLTTGRYVLKDPEGLIVLLETMRSAQEPVRIESVDCKGKFMWWTLAAGNQTWWLWYTYGMSGQWHVTRTQHAAFRLQFDDNTEMYFTDQRHFGTLKFVNDKAKHEKKLKSLGPDMLADPTPDATQFRQALLRKHGRTLAEVLMDQSVISGVGNYVKAESLYLAELSPHRIVRDMTVVEIERLRQQVVNVMRASYNTGGATIRSYRNPDGSTGQAQRRFLVYGHRTDTLGNPVIKEETLDGRTTHWCPAVQR